jgi:hopanoid biosynthesis associated RND transporter like protein HpnN
MTMHDDAAASRLSKRYRALAGLAAWAVSRPRLVLTLAAAVTVVAVVFIPRVEIVTDRGALVDSDEPAQRRYRQVSEMFGSLSLAVAVLQGPQREALRAAADELAPLLEGDERIRSVFYRLDMAFFQERALLYLTPEQLDCVDFALSTSSLGAPSPDGSAGLLALIRSVSGQFATASAETRVPEHCQTLSPLRLLTRLFAEIGAWTTSVERDQLDLLRADDMPEGGPSAGQYGVDDEGYLVESQPAAEGESDSHLLFMLVQPESTSSDEAEARAVTAFIRQRGRAIAQRHGVSLGVTGMPAIITDEMGAVRRDVKQTIITSIICVLLLFLVTFRSLRATALVSLPLVLGLIWTAGFAAAVYEHLTMVSVYFAAVLFGLGIAFGIHLLSRFDEARRAGQSPAEAVRTTMVGAGPGVVTGGVTTAAAFLAVGLCDFKGFAQLGVVAGSGVLLMLVGSLTVMPASLYLWPGRSAAATSRPSLLRVLGGWLERHHRAVLATTVALVALGVYGATKIPFDYDFSKLLPARVEALTYYRLMEERSAFAPDVTISVASSLEQAERLRQQLEGLDTVARAEAVSKYLPGSAEEQQRRVERIRQIATKAMDSVTGLHQQARKAVATKGRPVPAAVATALEELGDAAEDAWFAAQQTGRAEADDLSALAKTVRASAAKVRAASASVAGTRLAELEEKLFQGMVSATEVLITNLRNPGPLDAAELPEDIRRRFLTSRDGDVRYAVYAYPTGRVGDREFLDQFYEQVVAVDAEVTGFPITHYFHGELARRAFFQAALYAALATLLLLAIDFRRVRDVVLAAIPLAVGASLMLGTMTLLGWSYNFVNVVALPLVFGAGVDFGVHLVHRFRQEGNAVSALGTTGRPVVLSAIVTLVGIGGLALAQHRGAASLGWLMVLGIAFCLMAAGLVLPAAMVWWSRHRGPAHHGE